MIVRSIKIRTNRLAFEQELCLPLAASLRDEASSLADLGSGFRLAGAGDKRQLPSYN